MPWQAPQWAGFTVAPREALWGGAAAAAANRRGGAAAWCDADPDLGQTPKVRCQYWKRCKCCKCCGRPLS